MTDQLPMPDPSVDQRLLGNLRRARSEMEETGPQLDEVIAKFDEAIRQQRIHRNSNAINEKP
jgi:hypothetical protein